MIGKKIPGRRSNIALLLSSLWAILGLFVLIIGHLVLVFFCYGFYTQTDTLADLATFLPILSKFHLYITAGLAVMLDIWILISQRKQRAYKIKR